LGKTVISKSRWQTDEFPIKLEFFREMGRQGLDAESFSGVMTSEQKVDAQFFGGDRSPVRRFAGNESVDSRRQSCARRNQTRAVWEMKTAI
jgi:hypothetical protein